MAAAWVGRVSPGQTAFTMTGVVANSAASVLVRALRAALPIPYVAGAPPRNARAKTVSAYEPAPLLTLTIRVCTSLQGAAGTPESFAS
jgi:hypothetical protein